MRADPTPIFVSFEGIDGAGKSTQVERLRAFLEQRGRKVFVTREPGGTELGERIRELLLDGDDVVPWAEAYLFAAARAQLVERVLRPALARGYDVIVDRYVDSSLAYQGVARGLGLEAVLAANQLGLSGLMPTITLFLELPASQAAGRRGGAPDRIEAEDAAFHAAVAEGFRDAAALFPDRIHRIDASGPPRAVLARVREAVGL